MNAVLFLVFPGLHALLNYFGINFRFDYTYTFFIVFGINFKEIVLGTNFGGV